MQNKSIDGILACVILIHIMAIISKRIVGKAVEKERPSLYHLKFPTPLIFNLEQNTERLKVGMSLKIKGAWELAQIMRLCKAIRHV